MVTPHKPRLWAVVFLAASVGAVYASVTQADFINFDDPGYVTENLRVLQGLNADNIRWAFTEFHFANWHPLTWLSHMLDVDLYGRDARGHHVTNLLLHVANTLLLLWVFHVMTGNFWRSFAVAALFGLHPIQVESVAWISERKNVLSMFFGAASMLAYAYYARRSNRLSKSAFFVLVFTLFALSLMAKPMLVTLPCVLLLLDLWPLRRLRFQWSSIALRCVEKVPLLLLSIASSYLTYQAQHGSGSVLNPKLLPLEQRVQNAALAYFRYLADLIYPVDLVPFYPHPIDISPVVSISALVALTGITVAAILCIRRFPHVTVGWLWFVGTLVPMIGVVQVGLQSHADRYMYFSIIGIGVIVAWSWPVVSDQSRVFSRRSAAAVGVCIMALMSVMTAIQSARWHNSVTLFTYASRVRPSGLSFQNLGAYYIYNEQPAIAEEYFREALSRIPHRHRPYDHTTARVATGLARALYDQGRIDEAEIQLRSVITAFPGSWESLRFLGMLLVKENRASESVPIVQRVLQMRPEDDVAWDILGQAYLQLENPSDAAKCFGRATELQPYDATHWTNLAIAYSEAEQYDEAEKAFTYSMELVPDHPDTLYNFGYVRLLQQDYEAARTMLSRAVELNPEKFRVFFNLAQAQLQLGEHAEGKQTLLRALQMEPQNIQALQLLGYAELALGNPDGAKAAFQRALEIEPDDKVVQKALRDIEQENSN